MVRVAAPRLPGPLRGAARGDATHHTQAVDASSRIFSQRRESPARLPPRSALPSGPPGATAPVSGGRGGIPIHEAFSRTLEIVETHVFAPPGRPPGGSFQNGRPGRCHRIRQLAPYTRVQRSCLPRLQRRAPGPTLEWCAMMLTPRPMRNVVGAHALMWRGRASRQPPRRRGSRAPCAQLPRLGRCAPRSQSRGAGRRPAS